jgi:hypothetical protein
MQTKSIAWEHSSSYEKYLSVGLIPDQIDIKGVNVRYVDKRCHICEKEVFTSNLLQFVEGHKDNGIRKSSMLLTEIAFKLTVST